MVIFNASEGRYPFAGDVMTRVHLKLQMSPSGFTDRN